MTSQEAGSHPAGLRVGTMTSRLRNCAPCCMRSPSTGHRAAAVQFENGKDKVKELPRQPRADSLLVAIVSEDGVHLSAVKKWNGMFGVGRRHSPCHSLSNGKCNLPNGQVNFTHVRLSVTPVAKGCRNFSSTFCNSRTTPTVERTMVPWYQVQVCIHTADQYRTGSSTGKRRGVQVKNKSSSDSDFFVSHSWWKRRDRLQRDSDG